MVAINRVENVPHGVQNGHVEQLSNNSINQLSQLVRAIGFNQDRNIAALSIKVREASNNYQELPRKQGRGRYDITDLDNLEVLSGADRARLDYEGSLDFADLPDVE